MKAIVRYFTRRLEFAEAVAREVERALAIKDKAKSCFSQHIEKVVRCSLDQEYEVFRLDVPAKVSGLFDLSEMRGGDRVEIEILAPVANRPEKKVDRWILDNFQEIPVFVLPTMTLPSHSRVVIKQTRGTSVVVGVEMFAFE